MAGDFVTAGGELNLPARVWNDFVRTRDTVDAQRTITGVPQSPRPVAGGIQLFHAVIIEACNSSCSTYRVQRVHRYLRDLCAECDGSGSGSGSGG